MPRKKTVQYVNKLGVVLRLPNEKNIVQVIKPEETVSGDYWAKYPYQLKKVDK